MNSIPFFSVIIPVYNVENYLNECVDSVLVQSFEDLEIILVDDGSPDNCPKICDEYSQKDYRVRVIHKTNGGLSEARNYGINAAKGQFILFLDSDDYWDDQKALEKINDVLCKNEESDIVLFQAKLLYPEGNMIADSGKFIEGFNLMEPREALSYLAKNGLLIGSACSKVVRRTFLVENSLFFKVGIKSEDIDWIIRVANCLPKYIYIDQYFYIYRKGRSESITANVDGCYLKQFADMLEGFTIEYQYIDEEVRRYLMSIIAYEFSILMAKTANLNDVKERKMLTDRLRNMQGLLEYDMHPKVRKINVLKRLIGFDLSMKLLGIYLKYRKR